MFSRFTPHNRFGTLVTCICYLVVAELHDAAHFMYELLYLLCREVMLPSCAWKVQNLEVTETAKAGCVCGMICDFTVARRQSSTQGTGGRAGWYHGGYNFHLHMTIKVVSELMLWHCCNQLHSSSYMQPGLPFYSFNYCQMQTKLKIAFAGAKIALALTLLHCLCHWQNCRPVTGVQWYKFLITLVSCRSLTFMEATHFSMRPCLCTQLILYPVLRAAYGLLIKWIM